MEQLINWTNVAASWFVDLSVGWQMFLTLLVLIPICYVIADFILLPIIDAVQSAYRSWVTTHTGTGYSSDPTREPKGQRKQSRHPGPTPAS